MLNRIYGVGAIAVFGARDYSMRVWLDPDRLYALWAHHRDVVTALQGQNGPSRFRRAQPAAGRPTARIPNSGADRSDG